MDVRREVRRFGIRHDRRVSSSGGKRIAKERRTSTMAVDEYSQMPQLDMLCRWLYDQCRVIRLHFLSLAYEIDADLLRTQMVDKEGSEDRLLSSERRMS